jgi:hypothetical protein
MKKTTCSTATFIFLVCFLFVQQVWSQQTVRYGEKTFGDCETIEALIGTYGETFTIYIAEHELRPGYGGKYERSGGSIAGGDFIENMPKGYDIGIEVFFANGVKFPIRPEDEMEIDLSRIVNGLGDHNQLSDQIDKVDKGAMESEAKALTTKKLSAEEQARLIAEQLQQGKITPDEAMKKMEAIQNEMLAAVDNSGLANVSFEEPEERSNYSIQFMDTKEQILARPLTGKLRIIRFDENVFEASFTGQHHVKCRERRAAVSPEEEAKCGSLKSKILPDTKVLEEGAVNFSINVNLKKFEDFRE